MYTATLIFAKKEFDDEFHALDQAIAAAAKAIPGYLGEETCENPTNGLVSNVYYWETLEASPGPDEPPIAPAGEGRAKEMARRLPRRHRRRQARGGKW
jgi:hypothetical protein